MALLHSILAALVKIFSKNDHIWEKVKYGPETPKLLFLQNKFPTNSSFLGRLKTDFQKQGKNLW